MRSGVMLALLGLVAASCGGVAASSGSKPTGTHEGTLDGSGAGSTSSTNECVRPPPGDGGPGACTVGRALVNCTSTNGGCTCVSDDPAMCAGCNTQLSGSFSCENQCASNEYAVSCGGLQPPGAGIVYQSMPAECRVVYGGPGGNAYACCPCQ